MKTLLIASFFFLAFPGQAQMAEGTYRCIDSQGKTEFRNFNITPDCKKIETEKVSTFQSNLKIGDQTTDGLVIEVKRPIAKVQTPKGEKWFRIEELRQFK